MDKIKEIKLRRANLTNNGKWNTTHYAGGLNFSGPLSVIGGTDPNYGEPRRIPRTEADVEFIAHAPADIDALLTIIDEPSNRNLTSDVDAIRNFRWAYKLLMVLAKKLLHEHNSTVNETDRRDWADLNDSSRSIWLLSRYNELNKCAATHLYTE